MIDCNDIDISCSANNKLTIDHVRLFSAWKEYRLTNGSPVPIYLTSHKFSMKLREMGGLPIIFRMRRCFSLPNSLLGDDLYKKIIASYHFRKENNKTNNCTESPCSNLLNHKSAEIASNTSNSSKHVFDKFNTSAYDKPDITIKEILPLPDPIKIPNEEDIDDNEIDLNEFLED